MQTLSKLVLLQCRDAKPIRDLEAILQREQDIQRIELEAVESAVRQAVTADILEDDMHISSAPDMELCSACELGRC